MLAASFARLIGVGGGGARLYRRDGSNKFAEGESWCSITEAASSERPFLVDVRRTMLGVDCDDLVDAATTLETELLEAGHKPVVFESGGGPGRLHLYARIEDPVAHAHFTRRAHELKLNPTDKIRPPYSPHRLGGRSTLLRGAVDPAAALALLGPASSLPKVPRRIRELLKSGQHPTRYRRADGRPDRSAIAQAIVTAMVAAGWRESVVRSQLLDPKNRGGAKYQALGRADAEREIRRMYQKAVARIAASPQCRRVLPAAVRDQVAAERARAAYASWKGTGGGSRLALLGALHDVAERTGCRTFAASTRQLAEAAELGLAATSRGLRRLVQDGWMVRIAPATRAGTMRWRLPETAVGGTLPHAPLQRPKASEVVFHWPPFSSSSASAASASAPEKRAAIARISHDASRFRGVGKQKLRLLGLVESGRASTVAELVALIGTTPRTVREHAGVLVELGLLVRLPGRRLARGPATLDQVAAALGTAGAAALQRSAHETEREVRRAAREELAARSGATGSAYVVRRAAARFVPVRRPGGATLPGKSGRRPRGPSATAFASAQVAAAGAAPS